MGAAYDGVSVFTMTMVEILDDIRREQKLNWAQISRMSGVTETTLANWRHKVTSPNVLVLERVLAALGYELEVVLKEPEL